MKRMMTKGVMCAVEKCLKCVIVRDVWTGDYYWLMKKCQQSLDVWAMSCYESVVPPDWLETIQSCVVFHVTKKYNNQIM